MFRPSPCPIHYDGHLATMPSADFCLIPGQITAHRAIGSPLIRSSQSRDAEKPRHLFTRASLVYFRWLVKQISPDKNVNCLCTASSFTVSRDSWVSLCLANSPLRLGLI